MRMDIIHMKNKIYITDIAELWNLHGDLFLVNVPNHVSSKVINQFKDEDTDRTYVETQNSVYICVSKPLERMIQTHEELEVVKEKII